MVLPGPLGLLVLMSGLYWVGLSVLSWVLRASIPVRVFGLISVGFFPPVFSNVAVVWKDTLMQAALLSGLACIVVPTKRLRTARYVLGLVFFIVAIGAR